MLYLCFIHALSMPLICFCYGFGVSQLRRLREDGMMTVSCASLAYGYAGYATAWLGRVSSLMKKDSGIILHFKKLK